jgi:hypothetical protein
VVSIDLGSSTFKLHPPSNGASKLFGDENPPSKGYNDDTCPSRVYWQRATQDWNFSPKKNKIIVY